MNTLKKVFFIAVAFAVSCSAFAAKPKKIEDVSNYRDLTELHTRGGLPNFFKKAANGGDVRVAYLGGSITAQGGWRVQSLELFKKIYPMAKFSEINAAIGGTGSDFGVLRVGAQVIARKPDLVFVEFAVNDGKGGDHSIKQMEGIVRQIWNDNPNCDICFVYTLTVSDAPLMLSGKVKRSVDFMEKLADFYKIPSIDFGKPVIDLLNAGKLVMKTDSKPLKEVAGDSLNMSSKVTVGADGKIPFARDGVHPYHNTGHKIYTGAIERSIKPLRAASSKAGAHEMPAPMFADCLQKVLTADLSDLPSMQKLMPRKLSWQDPIVSSYKQSSTAIYPYFKLVPGDEFEIKFKGKMLSMMRLFSFDGGQIEVTVDDNKPRIYPMYDMYSAYRRQSCMTLARFKNSGVHTVKIRVLDGDFLPDKIKKISRVAKDPNNPIFKDKFAYVSTLFVVGELVK